MKKTGNKKSFGSRIGQGSVEYILIIAVVVGVVMVFKQRFQTGLATITEKMFAGAAKNVGSLTGGDGN